MTLQLRCIKVCQSVRIFPLQHYIMQKDAGRGSWRKNDFSSEFSGCLVCPLHYSYVGWSLITCQAATALNQLFYWPRALSSVSLGLSSALSVFCLPSLRPGVMYFSPPKCSQLCPASQCRSSNSANHRQDTYSKHNRERETRGNQMVLTVRDVQV